MAHIFISSSPTDWKIADRVAAMASPGTIWFDKEASGGSKPWRIILDQLMNSDLVIYLLSDISLRTPYCHAQCRHALRLNKPILPVIIQSGVQLDRLPADIRRALAGVPAVNLTGSKQALSQFSRALSALLTQDSVTQADVAQWFSMAGSPILHKPWRHNISCSGIVASTLVIGGVTLVAGSIWLGSDRPRQDNLGGTTNPTAQLVAAVESITFTPSLNESISSQTPVTPGAVLSLTTAQGNTSEPTKLPTSEALLQPNLSATTTLFLTGVVPLRSIPSKTPLPTDTLPGTSTATLTPTDTLTPTPTSTLTRTHTSTTTFTPVPTQTPTLTATTSLTPTPTSTLTWTPTSTTTFTPAPTQTPTSTPTRTPTSTTTFTPAPTQTPALTATSTPVPDRDGDGIPDTTDACPDESGTEKKAGCPYIGQVNATSSINLRAGPGTKFAVIGKAVAGEKLKIWGRNQAGDWLQVSAISSSVTNPTKGWAYSQLITTDAPIDELPVLE